MRSRSSLPKLMALGLSASLAWGCSTPLNTLILAPARQAAAAPASIVAAPASATPLTLNGTSTFNGSPTAGYSIEVYDAKTGKPIDKKADLAGVTTLALLDKDLKTDKDGKFSLQIVNLSAGQALHIVCRSESGKARLETVVFGDRQVLPYKVQQVTDVVLELNELTTALSYSTRGVLTASLALKPAAAASVLSKLAGDLGPLSAKLDAVLKGSSTLAGELARAETANEQANAMRTLVENAGALRQLTQLVADRVCEIAQQARESNNQNPGLANPEIQALLQRVEFLGTRIAGHLDNKAVELIYGASRQPLDGSNLDSFITMATTTTSSGGSGGSRPTYAELVKNLNNQDDDQTNDGARATLQPAAITDVLELFNANKAAFGADDWRNFEALGAQDDLAPATLAYRVLGASPSYTARQQAVGKLILERVFRNHGGYRVLQIALTPYRDIEEVRKAFHEAVELETDLHDLLALVKTAATTSYAVAYRVLDAGSYTPEQQGVINALQLELLGKLDADFELLDTWRIVVQPGTPSDRPASDIDGCQFVHAGASLKTTVQGWAGYDSAVADRVTDRIIGFFQGGIYTDPTHATLSDAAIFYGILSSQSFWSVPVN